MSQLTRAIWIGGFIAAALVACGDSYKEGEEPAADAGMDSTTPASDANGVVETSTPVDAGADVTLSSDASDAGDTPDVFDAGDPDAAYPFKDPSFQFGAPFWTTSHSAELEPNEPGVSDRGFARLAGGVVEFGAVSQTITMATPAASLRPALQYRFHVRQDSTGTAFPPVGVLSDGKPLASYTQRAYPKGEGDQTLSLCVGEAFYGAPHLITFSAIEFSFSKLELDYVGIIPQADCPENGVIPNGDFESAAAWNLSSSVAYHAGTGVGGSRSLRFSPMTTPKQEASQTVLVPKTSMTAPAITFHQSGTGSLLFSLDEAPFVRSTTAGPDEVKTFCLPPWIRGVPTELAIQAGRDPYYLDTDEYGMVVDLDNLAFVNEPKCAGIDWTENRDFENPDPSVPGWYITGGLGYTATRQSTGGHTGGYVKLTSTPSSCVDDGSVARAWQTFPKPAFDKVTGGVRVSFFYRMTQTGTAKAYGMDELLVPASDWTPHSVCLDEYNRPGIRQLVSFEVDGVIGGCGTTELDIDDVVVDTSATCPAR